MNKLSSKIKIKDIAEKAGVSAGTVDRVLHKRGNVSEETRRKVESILKQINYTPNLYASALASKRTFTFFAVIPSYKPGDYWEKIEQGINKGAEEFSDFKVNVQIHYFSQYSVKSFYKVMDEAIKQCPDGILLAPSLKPVTLELTRKMDNMGIQYVFIDSWIEDTNPLAYFGQDSYQSGCLGARLLLMQKPDIKEIGIFSFYHIGQTPSNQISLRMEGFNSYVFERKNDCKLHRATLVVEDQDKNEEAMRNLFIQYPHIEGAVIFSSRSYIVARFLEENKLNHITMIGYDLLQRNVSYLKNNTISFLIAQRPEEQGYKGIKALSDHFIFKKNIHRINFMPIDILTQENIDFYQEA